MLTINWVISPDGLDNLFLGDRRGMLEDSLPNLLHWDIYIDAFCNSILEFYPLIRVIFVVPKTEFVQILQVHIHVHYFKL